MARSVFKLRWGTSWRRLAASLATGLLGCSTYSASITVEPRLGGPEGDLVARARAILDDVAGTFGMEFSETDLRGMQRANESEASEYRTLAAYRNTHRSAVRGPGRVILVLKEHQDGKIVVVIRDLQSDVATEFTETLEREIASRLRTEGGPYTVEVKRGKVGGFYAP